MHFDIISLFPELFDHFKWDGVTTRSLKEQNWSFDLYNPRQHSNREDRRIDDRPFGGGAGMVMQYEPLKKTYSQIQSKYSANTIKKKQKTIYLSPTGEKIEQKKITELLQYDSLILLCGRYEGIDQRFIDHFVDENLSLGDFVLSGGELPAMCLIDAIVRHLPQTLGNPVSLQSESFSQAINGVLDYPQYTRPNIIDGLSVPQILLNGDHAKIEKWRRWQSLKLTQQIRPDLLSDELTAELEKLQKIFRPAKIDESQ